MLTGEDYPHLCGACQAAITQAAEVLTDFGPDTDNEEAAADYVYDNALFCGGRTCANKPNGE